MTGGRYLFTAITIPLAKFSLQGETVFAMMQIPFKTTKERREHTDKSFSFFLLHNILLFHSYNALGLPVTGTANTQVI